MKAILRSIGDLGAIAGLWLICGTTMAATITVGPWVPLFEGVELASGEQQAVTFGERNQQVLCLRVDLSDPNISLFTTPKCTNCIQETLSEGTSHFLEQYKLQVAVNGGFFASSIGPTDTPLGTPDDVYGLAISQGAIVSPADDPAYVATLLFSSNNMPFLVPTNAPPTNTTGIYTAVSGNHALLLQGTNLMAATPNDLDPRTAFGLSADRRYLFLMTIDGRQTGWSDGADFHETGEWLKRFGATDGINVDGGGSTTMVRADCAGSSVRLNRSSFVASYGRERNIGHNFGIYTKPLPSDLKNLDIEIGTTTANLTWDTDVPATTQVEYGSVPDYGRTTPLETRLTRKHIATIAGLTRGTTYYFRAISTTESQSLSQACRFTTLVSMLSTPIFDLTNTWIYTTNNVSAEAWTSPGYQETDWLGSGPGLLCVETSAYVGPKNTVLPPSPGQPLPRTYYFRTHFSVTGSVAGATLTLSNYVDDGAVFHLNGSEIHRLRMAAAPTIIGNTSFATGSPCSGTAQSGDAATNCPDIFTVTSDVLTNLVEGDNVLAVEVHNASASSLDIVFGAALSLNRPNEIPPRLHLWTEGDLATFSWNGEGFTLQQTSDLADPAGWMDVAGPVKQSPFSQTNLTTMFYRLRR